MALTHVPARNEVDPQYTWNDTSVFATVDEWAAELEALSAELDGVAAQQGHLAEGPRPLLDALHGREKLVQRAEKALIYAYLAEAVDTTNQEATQRIGRGMGVFGRLLGALAFIEPEILTIGREQLAAWAAAEPGLRVYDHYFDDLFRRQAHVRSPEIEEAMGLAADTFQGASATYAKLTDSDFQFAPARAGDGAELPVTQGSIDR